MFELQKYFSQKLFFKPVYSPVTNSFFLAGSTYTFSIFHQPYPIMTPANYHFSYSMPDATSNEQPI